MTSFEEACQIARQYGAIFNDEFLRRCFMEDHYTPAQVLYDLAVLVVAVAALVGYIAFYAVALFCRRNPASTRN